MPDLSFKTLGEMQQNSCKTNASNRLFGTKVDGEYRWISYAEFGELVDRCRAGFVSLGIEKGDRIACIANNRVEWAVGAYAAYGLGAIWVPMYEAQLPKEWKYILSDSGAKAVICATDTIHGQCKDFPNEVESLEHVINLAADGETNWRALLQAGAEKPVELGDVSADDVAGLIYTSGTTGDPKGVVLSHNNLCSNVRAMHDLIEIESGDTSLSFLPWAHSFGQVCELHALISTGASLGLAERVDTLMDNFNEVKPTLLFSVPRIFNRIYDGINKKMANESGFKRYLFTSGLAAANERRRLESEGKSPGLWLKTRLNLFDKLVFSKVRDRLGGRLKYAFSGGAALSPAVAEFIDNMNIVVYEGYGLTETSPIVTANSQSGQKIGSVGRPIPEVEVIIDGADGKPNVEGEVLVSGPNVMVGYYNRPDQTDEVIEVRDGKRIFRTGDLGKLDSDGFLYITGRVKELYKLENGKYVAPAPLEETIQLSGFVNQAIVYGFNKPYNVVLIVPDEAALKGWAAENDLEGRSIVDLCGDDRVRQMYQRAIAEQAKSFKGYERPKDFALIATEFSVEDDLLTPTLKYKRRHIVARYQELLDSLYGSPIPAAIRGRKRAGKAASAPAAAVEKKAAAKPKKLDAKLKAAKVTLRKAQSKSMRSFEKTASEPDPKKDEPTPPA
jgi:long-chain acyl-CoA synthetase